MKTTKEIIETLHSNYPNIDLLEEYKGANEKIGFICNECGYIWKTTARSVINSKSGCPKCGVAKKRRETAKRKFLEKLDPQFELIYYNDPDNVSVKCKNCGKIRVTTSNNILKYGCKHCSMLKVGETLKYTTEQFIEKAKNIHGDKYDYSKVNYINSDTKVCIICPEHGEFSQIASKHLSGQGCPKCSGKNWTRDDFIKYSSKIHNNYYNYNNLIWNGFTNSVTITCPKHGNFNQNAYVHLRVRCGCPKCNQSHGEVEVTNCLESLKLEYIYQQYIKNPYRESSNFCVDFLFKIKDRTYIIEYNGRQHYEPVEKFGGEEQFLKQQQRDSDLRKYCAENNINLLEIRYDIKLSEIMNMIKEFVAVPIEESSELLQTKIGEGCDANPEVTTETKESVAP